MTDYAVGDIQGCLDPLLQLLEVVAFDPKKDRLIAVGDLVNRGPKSLETLRFCYSLGDSFKTVLGNHDLHLLAIARGTRAPNSKDSFSNILDAPDREVLLHWLQQQPLLLQVGQYHFVHAGIPPIWDLATAHRLAGEVSKVLRSDCAAEYFEHMYGNQPAVWSDQLQGPERWRLITNYLTRMRFCSAAGELELETKAAVTMEPPFKPWFLHPQKYSSEDKIVFGHWAALEGRHCADNIFALDTGCVWGGPLRLMDLDNQQYFHQSA
ncbi:MAG: symmetrical bis(5'-nucleosyl)-tetraphosphatase [Porticoccaceae bacterium]